MKAERRHELQHNQLAAWLAQKFIAVRPYITTIVASIVAIVAAWMAYSWYSQSTAEAKAETWNQYYDALRESAAGDDSKLRDFIRDHSLEPAGVAARQRLAMMQMNNAAVRQLSSRDASRAAYQEAIDNFAQVRDATDDDTLKRFVSFQIALARESRYDLDDAIADYDAIVERWPESMEAERAALRVADLKNPETREWYAWHRTVNPLANSPLAPQVPVEPAVDLDTLPDDPPGDTDAPRATVPDDDADKVDVPATDNDGPTPGDATENEADAAPPTDPPSDTPSDPPTVDEKPSDESSATDPALSDESPSDGAPADANATDGNATGDDPSSDEPAPDDGGLNPPKSSS